MKKTALERITETSKAYRAREGAGEEGLANRASMHSIKRGPLIFSEWLLSEQSLAAGILCR